MTRYFIVSDIHGYYDEFIKALKDNGFDINNKEHVVISLGDVWDRGKQPVQIMEFLLNLYDQKRAILVRGNHEDLFEDVLKRGYFMLHDFCNGTVETFRQLAWYITKQKRSKNDVVNDIEYICDLIRINPTINRFLKATVDFFELDKFVFVHGFIPINFDNSYNKNWRKADVKKWCSARWLNGFYYSEISNIKVPNKRIVVGHIHASYGNIRKKLNIPLDAYSKEIPKIEKEDENINKIYKSDNLIAIDSSTHSTKKVNVLIIEDNKILNENMFYRHEKV